MAVEQPLKEQLKWAAASLASCSAEPRLDAELLLRHVLGRDRAWLLAHRDTVLSSQQQLRYAELIARRKLHEPIQYIVGEQEFWGLSLRVTPAVLIPRPETEHLVEAGLARLPRGRPVRIADVGTGSGAIAVALAHTLPLATIDALDIAEDALAVAAENARRHRVADRICFHRSDLLEKIAGRSFDAVLSNPPYVPEKDELEPQVRDWEPKHALFAGEDGLAIYRRLLPQAASALNSGGFLAVEFGYGQREALTALFAAEKVWSAPQIVDDLQGVPRIAISRLSTPKDKNFRSIDGSAQSTPSSQ